MPHHLDRSPAGIALTFADAGHEVSADRIVALAELIAERRIAGALDFAQADADWALRGTNQLACDVFLLLKAESDADHPETALISLLAALACKRPEGARGEVYDWMAERVVRLEAVLADRAVALVPSRRVAA